MLSISEEQDAQSACTYKSCYFLLELQDIFVTFVLYFVVGFLFCFFGLQGMSTGMMITYTMLKKYAIESMT